jgi:predicted PurR-regulated permease PerM
MAKATSETPAPPDVTAGPRVSLPATPAAAPPASPTFKFVAFIAVVAALYFGRDLLMPLALAVLLSFALAPIVVWLTKRGMPRVLSVIAAVGLAFAIILAITTVFLFQLGSLAGNITYYQSNIESKVRAVKDMDVSSGLFERVSKMMARLGHEIETATPTTAASPAGSPAPEEKPVQVQVVDQTSSWEVLSTLAGRLIGPLTTGGIIIVVVIFMLLNREDLRDRFIRLVSAGDLQRTTEALQDATERVGRYLLMQLIVNVTYGVPIAIGLWLIGVPNAPLWGLLALVLRFVPYVGPVVAAAFPLMLALAVDPGWSMVLWTAALFVVIELISNNIVEPLLYGSRTGLSPVAIIIAAIFWTWLWGPLGLLMSTPLTVCLAVLGHYVPQFEFLDVILGTEPVLEPPQQLYQRLLAGDPDEATELAEESLQDKGLVEFYQTALIPALAMGEADRVQGRMEDLRFRRIAESAQILVENLDEHALATQDAGDAQERQAGDDISEPQPEIAPGPLGGSVIYCAGGRNGLDDAAAAMLAQTLATRGAVTRVIEHVHLEPRRLPNLDLGDADTLVIGFFNTSAGRRAKYLVRRLRRQSKIRIGVVFWAPNGNGKAEAGDTGADFVVTSLSRVLEAVENRETAPPNTAKLEKPALRTAARKKASRTA